MDGMDGYGQVPVHGRNLGYAAGQLRQMGVPFQVQRGDGAIYLIVVPMPYMPMMAGAPWAYQQQGRGETWAHGLARMPWVRLVLVVGMMAGLVMLCQTTGVIAGLGLVALDPDVQAAAQAAQEEQPANVVEQVQEWFKGIGNPVETVQADIEKRQQEMGKQINEAILGTLINFCGWPLLAIALLGAGWLALRLYFRR